MEDETEPIKPTFPVNLSFLTLASEHDILKKIATQLGISKAQLARGCFRLGLTSCMADDLEGQVEIARLGQNKEDS